MRSFRRVAVCGALALWLAAQANAWAGPAPGERLTEPFLQNPDSDSVSVVWFTEDQGLAHEVRVGAQQRRYPAETRRIDGLFEDAASFVAGQAGDGATYKALIARPVFRHEARVDGLTPGERLSYFVRDVSADGAIRRSDVYSLAPAPPPGAGLKILLTSDHQLKPMTAVNIRKLAETVPRIDAVFFAGDLVNHPIRASEWFDDARGRAFFPVLQGRADHALERATPQGRRRLHYRGAPILQHAPIFPAIGNHEVTGRFDPEHDIARQFNAPRPRAWAEAEYLSLQSLLNPASDPDYRRRWVEDGSWSTRVYEDVFTLPADSPGGERYYFKRFGDVGLISLFATRIWRSPGGGPDRTGRFHERPADLDRPDRWGGGAFVFEPIARGSAQYAWLDRTLRAPGFQTAPIKIVMLHHPPRGLGDNVVPPFGPPRPELLRGADGRLTAVRYRYPRDDNPLIRDLEPLFEAAGVDLVFFGHSHLWQRLRTRTGMHYLESSNVGNTYGCRHGDRRRSDPVFDAENHTPSGDPYGLRPEWPSVFSPQTGADGKPSPCVASNELTVFSVLDTARRSVDSYVFDTTNPDALVQRFDSFVLERER